MNELRDTLKGIGLTQKQFADKTGYSESTISRWNSGAETMPQIAGLYLNLLEKLHRLGTMQERPGLD